MAQYQIETVTPDGRPVHVPIPDGFLDQAVRKATQAPVRELWEIICGGEARLDVDDVIRVLERHGWDCPDDLKED